MIHPSSVIQSLTDGSNRVESGTNQSTRGRIDGQSGCFTTLAIQIFQHRSPFQANRLAEHAVSFAESTLYKPQRASTSFSFFELLFPRLIPDTISHRRPHANNHPALQPTNPNMFFAFGHRRREKGRSVLVLYLLQGEPRMLIM